MQIVIKNLNWQLNNETATSAAGLQDECSGIANLEAVSPRAPIVVAFIIVAAAFMLGTAAGALITLACFHF